MTKAILIYGNIASFKWSEENYHRFFETFGKDIDIFLSHDSESESYKYIEDFKNYFNPIAIINEPINDTDIYKKYFEIFLKTHRGYYYVKSGNMTKHYINKKRVINLLKENMKKTGKVYDYICMTRLDLRFNTKIPWDSFDKLSNTLYIPEDNDFTGLNDRICIGDFNSIEKYASIYDNSVKLLEDGCEPFPEAILQAHVKDKGLDIKRFKLDTFIVRINSSSNNIRPLILNSSIFEKYTEYFSKTKGCSIMIDNYNDVVFRKIIPEKKYYSWFGYNVSAGKWLLTLDINSDKDISFPFIKTHNPDKFHPVNNIKADTLTTVSVDLNIEKDTYLIFIFDEIQQILNISFYNISLTKIG